MRVRSSRRVLVGQLAAVVLTAGLAVVPAGAATPAQARATAPAPAQVPTQAESEKAEPQKQPTPQATPPPVAECTTMPLAQWSQALPISADRGADDSECYAVSSATAGTYLWRLTREADTFRPLMEIFREDGTRLTGISWGGGYGAVTLVAGHTYRVLISGLADPVAPGYELGLYDVASGPCSSQGSTAFADTGIVGSFVGGELHCRELTIASDSVLVVDSAAEQPISTTVYRANGSTCTWARTATSCRLSGVGPFRMITRAGGTSDAAATSYEIWVDDTTSGAGCVAGPLTAWRSVPAITAQRGSGQAECFLVAPDASGRHFVEVSQDSGGWQSSVRLYDPDGTIPSISGSDVAHLSAGTTYRMVVTGTPGANPAGYGVTVAQIDGSSGCPVVTTGSWTAPAAPLSFPAGTEVDCREIADPPGGTIRFDLTDATTPVTGTLLSNSGQGCLFTSSQTRDCDLPGAGPYRVVLNAGTSTAHPPASASLWATNYSATEGCSAAPLAQWGESLPLDVLRSARPADCRLVTTQGAGTYLVRSEHELASGSLIANGSFQIYDSGGARMPHGSASTGIWSVDLAAETPYRVVFDGAASDPRAYHAGLHELATACPLIGDVTWDSEPTRPMFADGSETDCRELPGAEGTRLRVSLESTSDPDLTLSGSAYDATGRVICRLDLSVRFCPLAGPGPYRLVTTPRTPANAEIWAHDLATDDGCLSLATTAPMTDAAVTATLPANRVVTCWIAPLGSGDRMWLSIAGSDPDLPAPLAQLIGPDGILGETGIQALCQTRAVAHECAPIDVGPHRVLVSGGPFTSADYRLALRRLNQPLGCDFTRAVAQALPVVTGTIDRPDDLHCVQIPANPGDSWRFTALNPDRPAEASHPVRVYGPDGSLVCVQPGAQPCVADLVGRHAVVVSAGESRGRFELRGTCLTPACGDESLRVDSVTPDGVPAVADVALTLRGRGLSDTLEVRLEQGSTTLTATPGGASADGAELEVSLDLTGRNGTWDVVVLEPGAPETRLPGAVVIEAWEAPDIEASLITRGVYTQGRFTTFVVELSNPGNVPAIGLPLVLDGFPEDTELVPQFPMRGLAGPTGSRPFPLAPPPAPPQPPLPPRPPEQPIDTAPGPEGETTVIIVDKVPPKSTRTLKFKVKTPADSTRKGYDLEVATPRCDLESGSSPQSAWDGGSACVDAIVDVGVDFASNAVPVPCAGEMASAATSIIRAMTRPGAESAPFTLGDAYEIGASTLSCAADLGGVVVITSVMGIIGAIEGVVSAFQTCFDSLEAWMASIFAVDPNELVGPSGGGSSHALSGKGRHTFGIFFENKDTASAPAQEVRVSHHLDPSQYDLTTVRFGGLDFGERSWSPASETSTLDHVLQLGDGLQLDITSAAGATGELSWHLLTEDVLTGEIPDDPRRGFLPPNVDGTEGQGVVWLSVEPRSHPDGTVLSSYADIWFDLNAPIRTNTWANLVDTTPPTATVTAPATAPGAFPVSWGGADATSGVAGVDVLVSVDGGPTQVWKRGVAPGSATYDGVPGHTYRFSVTSHDHASLTSAVASTTTTVGTSTGPVQPPESPPPAVPTVPTQPPTTSPVPETVDKARARLRVTGRSTARGILKLRIKVTADGKRVRKARLVIKDGRKVVRKVVARRGVVTVKLKGLRPGKHRIKVTFKGNKTVSRARKRVVVRVR